MTTDVQPRTKAPEEAPSLRRQKRAQASRGTLGWYDAFMMAYAAGVMSMGAFSFILKFVVASYGLSAYGGDQQAQTGMFLRRVPITFTAHLLSSSFWLALCVVTTARPRLPPGLTHRRCGLLCISAGTLSVSTALPLAFATAASFEPVQRCAVLAMFFALSAASLWVSYHLARKPVKLSNRREHAVRGLTYRALCEGSVLMRPSILALGLATRSLGFRPHYSTIFVAGIVLGWAASLLRAYFQIASLKI